MYPRYPELRKHPTAAVHALEIAVRPLVEIHLTLAADFDEAPLIFEPQLVERSAVGRGKLTRGPRASERVARSEGCEHRRGRRAGLPERAQHHGHDGPIGTSAHDTLTPALPGPMAR